MPSAVQVAELTIVTDDMVSSCMHTLGFDYEPLKQSPSQYYELAARVQVEMDSRIWGISDLQAAEQVGFDLPKWYSKRSSSKPVSPLPAREILALMGSVGTSSGTAKRAPADSGIPTGGCETESKAELASYGLGQSEPYDSLPTDISLQSFSAARSSAQVKRAFAKWSACMASYGYHYANPFSAASSFASTTTISRQQIQVAVSDIECARKVNVQGVGFSVESAYQNQMIHRYAWQLTRLLAQLRHQTGVLAKLVKQYGVAGSQ